MNLNKRLLPEGRKEKKQKNIKPTESIDWQTWLQKEQKEQYSLNIIRRKEDRKILRKYPEIHSEKISGSFWILIFRWTQLISIALGQG